MYDKGPVNSRIDDVCRILRRNRMRIRNMQNRKHMVIRSLEKSRLEANLPVGVEGELVFDRTGGYWFYLNGEWIPRRCYAPITYFIKAVSEGNAIKNVTGNSHYIEFDFYVPAATASILTNFNELFSISPGEISYYEGNWRLFANPYKTLAPLVSDVWVNAKVTALYNGINLNYTADFGNGVVNGTLPGSNEYVALGMYNAGANPSKIIWFKNIKIGTTLGASDILNFVDSLSVFSTINGTVTVETTGP